MERINIKKTFFGKRILVVTAHPDDESYVAAGTMYKNTKLGGSTYVLCATLGERGTSHLKKPVSRTNLKSMRKKELMAAGRCLKLAGVHFAGLPDGLVVKHKPILYKKTLSLAKKLKPEFILSFGADGISGHNDHIAAGKVARRVAEKLHIPFVAFALPPRVIPGAHAWLFSRRKAKHYAGDICFTKPNLRVAIDAAIKIRALRCHFSQMDDGYAFTGFPEYAVRELLKAEYFVLD